MHARMNACITALCKRDSSRGRARGERPGLVPGQGARVCQLRGRSWARSAGSTLGGAPPRRRAPRGAPCTSAGLCPCSTGPRRRCPRPRSRLPPPPAPPWHRRPGAGGSQPAPGAGPRAPHTAPGERKCGPRGGAAAPSNRRPALSRPAGAAKPEAGSRKPGPLPFTAAVAPPLARAVKRTQSRGGLIGDGAPAGSPRGWQPAPGGGVAAARACTPAALHARWASPRRGSASMAGRPGPRAARGSVRSPAGAPTPARSRCGAWGQVKGGSWERRASQNPAPAAQRQQWELKTRLRVQPVGLDA